MIDLKLSAAEPTFLSLTGRITRQAARRHSLDDSRFYQMLYMNDAMRSCLMKLGFATDLSNTADL